MLALVDIVHFLNVVGVKILIDLVDRLPGMHMAYSSTRYGLQVNTVFKY